MTTKAIKGYRFDGKKLVKTKPKMSVSARIQQKKSKKIKVAKPVPA